VVKDKVKLDLSQSTSEHPFAQYIRILGKGKTGTRSLDQREARQAFDMILRGEAEPLQVGAFLMLLRVKEESPEELAGFVQACRDNMRMPPADLRADLDWSSYAGKKHQHPWFILSMLLLSEAGHRVFVHGSAGHTAGRLSTETAMQQLNLPIASDWADVKQQLEQRNLSYLPLDKFCSPLQELMQLKPLLGLRSPVNTLSRMINPLLAPSSLRSIFHPSYARLHQEADRLLGQPRALVFKGDSGEAEIKPQADTRICLLQKDQSEEFLLRRSMPHRVKSVDSPSIEPLSALWHGSDVDQYGLDATLMTAATALVAIEPGLEMETALSQARELWGNRNKSRLS
jgi:anthranilate phosphoribosyltransferase